ncbi:MAG: hypothetical protein K2P70_04485 [Hyphomonadaceae bacterium]|nr:hypothetical protein [Hyphomonadaceae bacterium]
MRAEVERKAARAISRRTGKPVAHGEEPLEIKGQWGPASIGFKFDMPPQAAEERIFELARMQVAAFFYWITFDTPSSKGGFMPGDFAPLNETRKPDWGNPQSLWFMQTTASWDWRIHAIGADGFFKLAMKKKSETEHIWSWALEWNHNLRVCGFFGDPTLIDALAQGIPTLEMTAAQRSPKRVLRYRKEVSLEASDDTMFTLPQVVDAELTR